VLRKPSTITKNVISVGAAQLFSGLLYLATVALIARHLGTNGFGGFSYVIAYVNIFQFVADLGIVSIFIREVSRDKTRIGHFLGVLKSLYWIFSFFSMLIIIFGIRLTTTDPELRIAAYPAAVATIALFHVFGYAAVFRAFEHMEINSAGLVFSRFLFLVFVITVIKLEMGVVGILAALALSSLTLWWVYYMIVARKYTRPRLSFEVSAWSFMISEGLSTGGTIILRKTLWYMDIFLLKAFATSEAVGLFNSVYQIVQMLYLIPWTLMLPFLPVFSRLSLTDPQKLHKMLHVLLKVTWAATLPLLVWTIFAAPAVIEAIYGTKFSVAADGLKIIIWTIPFLFPTSIFFFFFTAIDRQKAYLICVTVALVIKLAVNALLIPKMGFLGSCWATLVSDFCHYWICIILLKRAGFYFSTLSLIAIPALGSLFSALCLLPVRGSTSLAQTITFSVLAVFVYAAIIIFSKYLKREDLGILTKS
jgi:O-antigen/teichoic acid export membrane protein